MDQGQAGRNSTLFGRDKSAVREPATCIKHTTCGQEIKKTMGVSQHLGSPAGPNRRPHQSATPHSHVGSTSLQCNKCKIYIGKLCSRLPPCPFCVINMAQINVRMPGYGALAALMATHQNVEAFRRFSKMNMESLLQMQAGLLHLEMEIETARSIPELNKFDRVWIDYSDTPLAEGIRGLFERSRSLLDQYCEITYLWCTCRRLATDSMARRSSVINSSAQRPTSPSERHFGASTAMVR